MKNSKSQIIKVRVDELLKLTENLYQVSASTIVCVGQLYLFRDFLLDSGLLKVLVNNLQNITLDGKNTEIEMKITNHLKLMFNLI